MKNKTPGTGKVPPSPTSPEQRREKRLKALVGVHSRQREAEAALHLNRKEAGK